MATKGKSWVRHQALPSSTGKKRKKPRPATGQSWALWQFDDSDPVGSRRQRRKR